MLEVLALFKPEQPVIDIDLLREELGNALVSAYRHVRELANVGLLVKLPRGYAVGPRVIALDRHMTQFDPLLAASEDFVSDLVAQTNLELLIGELYGDTPQVAPVVVRAAGIRICDSVMGAGLTGSSYLRSRAARANTSDSPASSEMSCMD